MSPLEVCSFTRWQSLSQRLGLPGDRETYAALVESHAEKHRTYHTLDHISACLSHLDSVRDRTENPDEIEMALWFHDAVYDPFSGSNEEDSAAWATDWLQKCGANKPVIARIADHILATKSHDTPDLLDGQYMLDIDLSILGTARHIYDQFETNIRREYKRVPGFIFRRKRKAILQGFLSRKSIYTTAYFQERLEKQARSNLAQAISQL